MSEWIERFENHEVLPIVKQIRTYLTQISEYRISDTRGIEGYARLCQIQDWLESRLGGVDPNLVPLQVINNLVSNLTPLSSELALFVTDESPGHLANANAHADKVLMQLPNILLPERGNEVDGLRESISTFRKSAGQQVRRLQEDTLQSLERVHQVTNRADELTTEIDSQKKRLDDAITQFQKQFSEAEDRRRSQFETSHKGTLDTFDSFLKETRTELQRLSDENHRIIKEVQQEQVDRATANSTKFQAFQKSITDRLESFFKDSEGKFSELAEELKSTATGTLEVLETRKTEAAQLIKIISDIAVTGDYSVTADTNRVLANRFRWIALGFMALMAVSVSATVWLFAVGVDWKLTVFRIVATFVLGIPAFYAAKESALHRKTEVRSRKMQMELTAIDPYLESLPVERRDEIKAELTSKFFGQQDSDLEQIEKSVTGNGLLDIVKRLIGVIEKT